MRSWSHGHSLAVGALLALLTQRHAALVLTVVFVAGVAAGRLWSAAGSLSRATLLRLRRTGQ